MIYKELVDRVAKDTGQTKVTVGEVLDSAVAAITAALVAGETASIPSLGKWSVRDQAARTVKSPIGGISEIPARKRPKFAASGVLKSAIDGGQ